MYRFIATAPAPTSTKPLILNILGAINRNQTRDKTLADGTPPTPPAVDQFWERLGYAPEKGFAQVTYGPAIGFPDTIAYLKHALGLEPSHTVLIHDGKDIAQAVRSRAFKTQGKQVQLITCQDIETFLRFPKDMIQECLSKGGNVQIKLDRHLPQFTMTAHAPLSLAIEIVGDPTVHQQMTFQQGYIGPILEPVTQFLLPQFKEPRDTDLHRIPVPDLPTLEARFSAYFGEQTGIKAETGAVVSGGCSGALYDILRHSPRSEVLLCAPFFAPQAGIVESADKALSIADSQTQFIAFLAEKRGAEVMMTFPNNPDGRIPSLDEITHVIAVANANDHRLILDMTYFNFVATPHQENYKAVVSTIQSTAKRYLMIASGSKALGITKYRTALVLGDTGSLRDVREKSSKINSLSAIALGEALHAENRDPFRATLSHNVQENARYIREILNGTLIRPITELNTGLQKLHTVASKVPHGSIQFSPGDGALYGLLTVTASAAKTVMAEAAHFNLALTPGAVFSGQPIADVNQLLQTPQTLYRVSLMASPEANR